MARITFAGTNRADKLDASALRPQDKATLLGLGGDDTLIGSGNADAIRAGAGTDRLEGRAGNDRFALSLGKTPQAERDTVDGGEGFDTLSLSIKASQLTEAVRGELVRLAAHLQDPFAASNFISDALGLDLTNIEAVDLRVIGASGPIAALTQGPVAGSDEYVGTEDTPLVVDATNGVLRNDGGAIFETLLVDAGAFATALGGLVVLEADGSFTYTPPADANGPDSFAYTIRDGLGRSASATATIALTATPDAAIVTGTATGEVAEDGATTAAGQLLIADPDAGEAGFQTPGSLIGAYGTFTFDAATGAWGYTLVAELPGKVVFDTLDVTSLDGSATTTLHVQVTGIDDPATLGGVTEGDVAEDGTAQFAGAVEIRDADTPNARLAIPASLVGAYGSFAVAADGVWSYTLDNASLAVQALGGGAMVEDRLTVATEDGGASVDLVVHISGANDVATIGGSVAAQLAENAFNSIAVGTLTITDPDAGEAGFRAPDAAALQGTYGAFSFDPATGGWTYQLDTTLAGALRGGEVAAETLTVTSLDGTASETIRVEVVGVNDAASFGGTRTGAVAEDGIATASGIVTVADRDPGEAGFRAPDAASLVGDYGQFSFDSETGAWGYVLNNAVAQRLGGEDKVIDTFEFASIDGTTGSVAVEVSGDNDAPVILFFSAGSSPTSRLVAGFTVSVTDDSDALTLVLNQGNGVVRTDIALREFDGVFGGFGFATFSTGSYVASVTIRDEEFTVTASASFDVFEV